MSYWGSAINTTPKTLTEADLQEAFDRMKNQPYPTAQAEMGARVARWWRSQPQEVRDDDVCQTTYMLMSAGHVFNPRDAQRRMDRITELGGSV